MQYFFFEFQKHRLTKYKNKNNDCIIESLAVTPSRFRFDPVNIQACEFNVPKKL